MVAAESATLPRVRLLCLPDVDRTIGGVKQLYRHVEHLVALGWDAAVVTEAEGFRPLGLLLVLPLSPFRRVSALVSLLQILSFVLPETYLGVDLGSFRGLDLSRFARVVFNQKVILTVNFHLILREI